MTSNAFAGDPPCGLTVGGCLSVSGATTTNGIANTGNIGTDTLSTTGQATLNSVNITNGATVGGSLDVSGATTTNGIANTGALTNTGPTNLIGLTDINTSGSGTTTIGNQLSQVRILGGNNTIGDSRTSENAINGASNTITATDTNALTALFNNVIEATSGNNVIAAGNNNMITSRTGSNTLAANAVDGTNKIEGKHNNIGVETANSINTIGNSAAGTTVALHGGNSRVSVAEGTASIRSGTGQAASGLTVTSTAHSLSTDPAELKNQLNGAGSDVSRANLAGASYVNRLEGDTLINGNTYINGRLAYTSSTLAATTVSSGQSILTRTGTTKGQMALVNKGETYPHAVADGNGRISIDSDAAKESSAAMTLTNGLGHTNGLVVTERKTAISGGTGSTSLILDDSGATFGKTSNGDPVSVTGVADGKSRWDAVNVGQLNRGVAIAASMAATPQVEQDKTYSLGAGTGYYGDETGIAVGGSIRLSPNAVIKAATSFSPTEFDQAAVNAGFAFSW